MLRNAVSEHDKKASQSRPISQSSFSTTSSTQKAAAQSVSAGYKNPLNPTSASLLNGLKSAQPLHRGGIKRSASGLAKPMDASFAEDPGSRYQPIMTGGSTKKGLKALQNVSFDENDFDSDIDLDIDEPLTTKTIADVSYPKLPSIPNKPELYTPSKKSASHQQQSPPGSYPEDDLVDFGHNTNHATSEQAPASSALTTRWSTSPPEHYQPAASSRPSLQSYAFDGRIGKSRAGEQQTGSPEARPAKRRTLPWTTSGAAQSGHEATQATSVASTKSRVKNTLTTPAPNKEKRDKSMFPWNTTASSVKEQQKKHREEAKKAATKKVAVDGTEESIRKATSKNKRPARVFLSEEQQHVLDLVIEKKKSVFFTGSAGTGKSVLMREIIASLRKKYQREPDRVAVTASTGLAACNVGGVTLHSFAGIGLGKEDVSELVKKIKRNQKAKHRWMRTKVLILDEVSMVDGELFDKLEAIARQIRNNARPFGGIQLVITGDFFQLPPVPDRDRVAKFAFDAATWTTSIEHTIGLHQVFRQKDPVFAGMLNEMREGRLTDASAQAFRKLSRPLHYEDSLDATELFPTRAEVDRANSDRLSLLQGEVFHFTAKDGGSITDKAQRDRLLQNCLAPELITLKKGAQVMLIKNIDESLVNGSVGRVIGFMDERQFDSYNNNETAFLQSPGGTIQGAAAEDASLDARQMMQGITTSRKWPLVRFPIQDGTWRDLLCEPETWKVELPNGEVQASRAQIPLILAWALSIHKAQGQTLDRVKVNLAKVFEKGQAYVALSRATSMAGLQVLNFHQSKVVAHERVRTFYSKLARVELAEKNQNRMEAMKEKPAAAAAPKARDYETNFIDGDFDDSAFMDEQFGFEE